MYDDGKYGNDTTYGKTAGIAHEYLCRKGIVPQETDKGTYKCTDVYYQLFTSRYVHNVEVAGIFNVT